MHTHTHTHTHTVSHMHTVTCTHTQSHTHTRSHVSNTTAAKQKVMTTNKRFSFEVRGDIEQKINVFCGTEGVNTPAVPHSRGRSLTRSGPGGSSWRSSAGTTRSGWTWWRRGRPRTWATATCTRMTTSTPTSKTLTFWIDPISFTVLVSWFSGPVLLWFVLIQKFFAPFFSALFSLLWGVGVFLFFV